MNKLSLFSCTRITFDSIYYTILTLSRVLIDCRLPSGETTPWLLRSQCPYFRWMWTASYGCPFSPIWLVAGAEDNLQFENWSIKIIISTYFECSLLIFSFEVNWIPKIGSKPLPTFENVGARSERKLRNKLG